MATHHTPSPALLPGLLLGALVQRLPLSGAALPEGCNAHLLPSGRFASRDGRPGNSKGSKVKDWFLDAESAAELIAAVKARQTPIVIDYEHQSLAGNAPAGGAPAAGWIEDLAYVEGRGLFARVAWTERAAGYIAADEYRYISPAFFFDHTTGKITRLVNAALTNTPALDGLDPVAAADLLGGGDHYAAAPQSTEETRMDKTMLALLCALLGLKADTAEAEVKTALEAACKALPAEATTLTALVKLASKPAAPAAPPADPDPAKYVPVETVTKMQEQLTALSAQLQASAEAETGKQIDAALADGRLAKPLADWARGLGKSDPKALAAFLSAQKPVEAFKGTQTGGNPPADDKGLAALSTDDKYVIEQLGLDPKTYLAARQAEEGK